MLNRTPTALAVLVLALVGGEAFAQTADSASATPFDAAQLAYENCHWQEAFAAFAELADRGRPEAARIALLMWRYGPALYRSAFSADAERRRRWSLLVTPMGVGQNGS